MHVVRAGIEEDHLLVAMARMRSSRGFLLLAMKPKRALQEALLAVAEATETKAVYFLTTRTRFRT
jgi:hypothetical protein